ncbi:hypothetical protein V6R21_14005 [Limibacter armeniacum]|uniref:hypothetical protein n=1 Tax=Limibacter armeniacum TaxID=466084 RepID=UPI002FE51D4F
MKTNNIIKYFLIVLGTVVISPLTTYAQSSSVKPAKEPDIKIEVNEQKDDQGNIIGYDSTFTYTYTDEYGGKTVVKRHRSHMVGGDSAISQMFGPDIKGANSQEADPFDDPFFHQFSDTDKEFDSLLNEQELKNDSFFSKSPEEMKKMMIDRHQKLMNQLNQPDIRGNYSDEK